MTHSPAHSKELTTDLQKKLTASRRRNMRRMQDEEFRFESAHETELRTEGSIAYLAIRLRKSRRTVQRWCQNGLIPEAVQISGEWRIRYRPGMIADIRERVLSAISAAKRRNNNGEELDTDSPHQCDNTALEAFFASTHLSPADLTKNLIPLSPNDAAYLGLQPDVVSFREAANTIWRRFLLERGWDYERFQTEAKLDRRFCLQEFEHLLNSRSAAHFRKRYRRFTYSLKKLHRRVFLLTNVEARIKADVSRNERYSVLGVAAEQLRSAGLPITHENLSKHLNISRSTLYRRYKERGELDRVKELHAGLQGADMIVPSEFTQRTGDSMRGKRIKS